MSKDDVLGGSYKKNTKSRVHSVTVAKFSLLDVFISSCRGKDCVSLSLPLW